MTPRTLSTRLLSVVALTFLLASPALAGWPADPTVNVPVCNDLASQYDPSVAPDGAGGALVTWRDRGLRVGVQRLSANGTPMWTTNGVILSGFSDDSDYPQVVSDGAGGAIVAWADIRDALQRIYVQRVSASGTIQWPVGGVAVTTTTADQSRPQLLADGAGGAIVTWNDQRGGVDDDVYAQRISANGTALWAAGGVAISTAAGGQNLPVIAPDGTGGAIITWYDTRSATTSYDIYAQRVSAAGAVQWTADGVAVCTADSMQLSPAIVADDAGGAIIAWGDYRNSGGRIYAQRVSTTGATQWTANGVLLAGEACRHWLDIASDGAGGAIVAWNDARDAVDQWTYGVYAQRVNASGTVLWTANGVPLCTASFSMQSEPCIVPDGLGGAIAAWDDTRLGTDVVAQRLNSAGVAQWGSGVALCTLGMGTDATALASDGAGGAIAAWVDWRNYWTDSHDIYAQRVDRWGCLGVQPTITHAADHPGDEGGVVDLTFGRSPEDGAAHDYVDLYWLWRQVPQAAALSRGARLATAGVALADVRGVVRTTVHAGQTYYWEYFGQVPATGASEYAAGGATACDSVAGSNPLTYFMVEARNTAGTMWWFSDPVAAYSVDNLAPATPSGFAGTYAGGLSDLSWNASPASDFACFQLHRGHGAGFVPGPATLIATTAATQYGDMAGVPCYYKLCAVDIHGNVSPYAGLLPAGAADVPGGVPAELSLSPPAPNPLRGSCTMRLALPRAAEVSLAVFDQQGRRVRTLLAGGQPAGEHAVTWDGRDDGGRLAPSGVYFVRAAVEGRTFTHRIAALR